MTYLRLSIKPQTKALLPLVEKEFLRHHSEFKGMRLSEDFLTKKAFEHYLK